MHLILTQQLYFKGRVIIPNFRLEALKDEGNLHTGRSWHPACFKENPLRLCHAHPLKRPQAGCPTHWSACWNGDHIYLWNRCRLSKLQVFAYVHFMQKAYGRKYEENNKRMQELRSRNFQRQTVDVFTWVSPVLNFTKGLGFFRFIGPIGWEGDKVGDKKHPDQLCPIPGCTWDLFRVLTVGQQLGQHYFRAAVPSTCCLGWLHQDGMNSWVKGMTLQNRYVSI